MGSSEDDVVVVAAGIPLAVPTVSAAGGPSARGEISDPRPLGDVFTGISAWLSAGVLGLVDVGAVGDDDAPVAGALPFAVLTVIVAGTLSRFRPRSTPLT